MIESFLFIDLVHGDMTGMNAAACRCLTKYFWYVMWYMLLIISLWFLPTCVLLSMFSKDTLHNPVVLSLALVSKFKVLVNCSGRVNWLIHLLIVGSEIRSCDLPVAIKQMFEGIATHESEEVGVFILQFLQVIFFDGFNDLVFEGLFHSPHIVVYSLYFFVMELYLVSVGHDSIFHNRGLYSWAGKFVPRSVREGGADH